MEILTRKYGPLPGWVYLLGAVGIGYFVFFRGKAGTGQAQPQPQTMNIMASTIPFTPSAPGGTSPPPGPVPQPVPPGQTGTCPRDMVKCGPNGVCQPRGQPCYSGGGGMAGVGSRGGDPASIWGSGWQVTKRT
jgi:hypothetical protein